MVYNWLRRFETLLLPPTCLLCGAPGGGDLDLCPACLARLPENQPACRRCALPLPPDAPDGALCGACSRRAPAFDRIIAPWRYDKPLDELIACLKFRQQLAAGRTLGLLLAEAISSKLEQRPDLILPVPQHPAKLRARGFNQAGEIAATLSRRFGIPWSSGLLLKTRKTDAQHHLNRRQRLKNLRGAFHYHAREDCRHVAVVDDVVTTGATATETARALKQAGVSRVEIWAVARTPQHE